MGCPVRWSLATPSALESQFRANQGSVVANSICKCRCHKAGHLQMWVAVGRRSTCVLKEAPVNKGSLELPQSSDIRHSLGLGFRFVLQAPPDTQASLYACKHGRFASIISLKYLSMKKRAQRLILKVFLGSGDRQVGWGLPHEGEKFIPSLKSLLPSFETQGKQALSPAYLMNFAGMSLDPGNVQMFVKNCSLDTITGIGLSIERKCPQKRAKQCQNLSFKSPFLKPFLWDQRWT